MPKSRILVVEDDSIITLELVDRLKKLGYEVCAKTGTAENAVMLAEGLKPDLVLMDIRLKGAMDGVEAAACIRSSFDIPVVFLTAYADTATLRRAIATEPYGYVVKPFEERDLHTAVEMALYKHRMEKKLRESEQWLSTTLSSIGDAVIATDQAGHVLFMNAVAQALTHQTQRQAAGQPISHILSLATEKEHRPLPCPVAAVLQDGQRRDLEDCLLLDGDEGTLPIDGSIAPIRDEKGQLQGAVLAFRDISRRKQEQHEREQLQARLFEAEKIEAAGALAADMAHDLNNLLTVILGSASLLAVGTSDGDQVACIQQAGRQVAHLARQIQALGHDQLPHPRPVDLNALLLETEASTAPLRGDGIRLVRRLAADLPPVEVDAAQMREALDNLVANACEAMPQGGELTLASETVRLAPADRAATARPGGGSGSEQARPGSFVRLSVSDTGPGIEPQTRRRIFEPLFTTKPDAPGLGLTIARSIVFHHGGWIEVESTPGQGATFFVYLPVAGGHQEPGPQQPGQGERILLVEGNDQVRASVAAMLRAGGYEVTAVASAVAALDAFENGQDAFDLLLCESSLPHRDGLVLAEQCRAASPGLAVLLTSSYADARAQWLEAGSRAIPFLAKPFDLKQLLQAVGQALARAPNS